MEHTGHKILIVQEKVNLIGMQTSVGSPLFSLWSRHRQTLFCCDLAIMCIYLHVVFFLSVCASFWSLKKKTYLLPPNSWWWIFMITQSFIWLCSSNDWSLLLLQRRGRVTTTAHLIHWSFKPQQSHSSALCWQPVIVWLYLNSECLCPWLYFVKSHSVGKKDANLFIRDISATGSLKVLHIQSPE